MAEGNDSNENSKERTSRHDLTYFRRWRGFRLWRLLLGLGLVGAAVVALEVWPFNYDAIYVGPLSSAHSFLANRCEACHTNIRQDGVRQRRFFFQKASNEACQACHGAPLHHPEESLAVSHMLGKNHRIPDCSDCHVEHQGPARLVQVKDQRCVDCHSDLVNTKPGTGFAPRIVGFHDEQQHRNFKVLDDRKKDPPHIAFHHAAHMGRQLEMLDHTFASLECEDCHRPIAAEGNPWPYQRVSAKEIVLADPRRHTYPDAGRELMTMPTYERNCSKCHDLKFDLDACDESFEHPRSPQDVINLPVNLRTRLDAYISKHKEKIRETGAAKSNDTAQSCAPRADHVRIPEGYWTPPAEDEQQWVQQRLPHDEHILWEVTCSYCHQLDQPRTRERWIERAQKTYDDFKLPIPPRMKFSVFSHEAHIAINCQSCHKYPAISECNQPGKQQTCVAQLFDGVTWKQTEDLLPGVATCQKCHAATPASAGKVENGCFLCHQYHKWNPQQEKFKGQYTIEQLTGKAPLDSVQMEKQSGNQ